MSRSTTRLLRPGRSALLIWVVLAVVSVAPVHADSISITGPQQTVFDWSEMACDPNDVPDGVVRVFRDSDNQLQLIRASSTNRRMIGPDLDHLTNDCTILRSSTKDPFPWYFDDGTWVNATHTTDGTVVNALLHSEYHGTAHPGFCPSGEFFRCRYNSVTYAQSTNGGDSYPSPAAPTQLVASIPYPYVPEMGRVGVFSPSNIVEKDGYHYAMLLISAGYKAQRQGACVMRTKTISDPTSWRAWDGAGFNVRFIDPYREPSADPNLHKCHPASFNEIGQIERSVTYNSYLDKFVVIGSEFKLNPTTGENPRGFYYSFSDDLVHWTDRELLLETPPFVCPTGPLPLSYPSVIDPSSSDRNFNTADQGAYLYMTRFNLPNCSQTPFDRDLVRVPIQFSQ